MHKTVLLKEAIDNLNLKSKDILVDCTAGAGGHSEYAVKNVPDLTVICIDLDEDALERTKVKLSSYNSKFHLVKDNFRNIDKILSELGIEKVNGIVMDLGISSYQFESSGRGFSFKKNEPLLMTMGKNILNGTLTAYEIVNSWNEEDLERIIKEYGEESFYRKIVSAIREYRINKNIDTSDELAGIIMNAVPSFYRNAKIHPATKTFQALRIAVNGELENLEKVLPKCLESLKDGGRISVISFHSLEDRIVKNIFRDWKKENLGNSLTKKPIIPTDDEVRDNPRSRSAKLRVFEKASQINNTNI